MIKISLKPISTNEAWQGKRFKSKKYKEFESSMLSLMPDLDVEKSPYYVFLEFGFSNKMSDIDNPIKMVLDVIQKRYLINDRDIYKLKISKTIVAKGEEFIKFKILDKEKRDNLRNIYHQSHELYYKWYDMRKRCNNPNVDRYNQYGGRGIKVCNEWDMSYDIFVEWCLANGYKDGLSLDRINVDGNYEPSNCRFIQKREQFFNIQKTYTVEYGGKKYSLAQLLYEIGKTESFRKTVHAGRFNHNFDYYVEKYNLKESIEEAIVRGNLFEFN